MAHGSDQRIVKNDLNGATPHGRDESRVVLSIQSACNPRMPETRESSVLGRNSRR
jgi:hypothetical protein